MSKGIKLICQLLNKLQVVYSLEVHFGAACHHYKPLPFDIMVVIKGRMGLVEFDGQQHFNHSNIFVKTNVDLINQQTRDVLKTLFAKKHSISLLRIAYDASDADIEQCLVQYLSALNQSPDSKPIYHFSNPKLYAEHIKLCSSGK